MIRKSYLGLRSPLGSVGLAILAALSAAACEGAVMESGAGGASNSTSTTSTLSTTSTGTTSTTDPASCSGGIGLDISFDDTDGTVYQCWQAGPLTKELDVDAAVVAVDGGAVTLDTCPPNADCTPELATLHVDAEGLALAIPPGTFVHLHFYFFQYINCPVVAEVTNLASWGGVANPTSTASFTWIRAFIGDQGTAQQSGPDFGLEPLPLKCAKSLPEEYVYDYRFYDALEPSNAIVVPVGEIGTLHVQRDSGAQVWTLGNARAGCVGGSGLGNCPAEGYPFDQWLTQAPE